MFTPFTSLTVDLQARVVAQMDFPSLMMLRATARASYALVRNELDMSLDDILTPYVSDPARLRKALAESGAFIGGSVALRFFLRLPPRSDDELDIFASSESFVDIFYNLLSFQHVKPVVDVTPPGLHVPGVTFFLDLDTKHGRRISLFRSSGHSLLPIARAVNSAYTAYVNPRHFGVVWPKLTFAMRAMPGVLSSRTSYVSTAARRNMGMDVKLWPWMWPDSGVPRQQCARRQFLCPAQERTFTDGGALCGSFDPLTAKPIDVRIAFRLSLRECRGDCNGPQEHLRSRVSFVIEY
ncbi:hypothetical protein OH76DRAFT_1488540 [Lentinus brumalis]|uniref:Uncharacterized protein n=1 Tax=Lentinus brumalis TaxID=2498619 RepID=A0A371CQK7_9APHY|nr:hypothetical protein OH76DRAFT_1488540 [Polyporus brumalis]